MRSRWCAAVLGRAPGWPFWCTCYRNNLYLWTIWCHCCSNIATSPRFRCFDYWRRATQRLSAAGRGRQQSWCLHSVCHLWCRKVRLCHWVWWCWNICQRQWNLLVSQRSMAFRIRSSSRRWTSAPLPNIHNFKEKRQCHLFICWLIISAPPDCSADLVNHVLHIWNQTDADWRTPRLRLYNYPEL